MDKFDKIKSIYDLVNEKIYKCEVPPNAVVVPGTRPIKNSAWGAQENLHLGCAIIVKYRDAKTSAAITLESLLR